MTTTIALKGSTERLNYTYSQIGVSWPSDFLQPSVPTSAPSMFGLLEILCRVRRHQSATLLVSNIKSKSTEADNG